MIGITNSLHFINCNNLDKYFSSNHGILYNKEIPLFYREIHTQFMNYYKQEPTNLLDILNQSIWYNNYIKSSKNYLINNRLEYKGISKIKDILDEKCDFINQSKINLKYKVIISFLELLNITSCILKSWKQILNNCQHLPQNIPIENCIQVQNTLKSLNKTTCKDMYWHILNLENYKYKPTCIKK